MAQSGWGRALIGWGLAWAGMGRVSFVRCVCMCVIDSLGD